MCERRVFFFFLDDGMIVGMWYVGCWSFVLGMMDG
jgi:hypothetical protein